MTQITLRPYQQDCIDAIPERGSYLVHMATGLGKTVTFSRIPRKGRMLILSHREELVRQPLKYFDCMTGVEMAASSAPHSAEVVSASVQSIVRRLGRYAPDDFDVIITDEAHHAAARLLRIEGNTRDPDVELPVSARPLRTTSSTEGADGGLGGNHDLCKLRTVGAAFTEWGKAAANNPAWVRAPSPGFPR